MIKIYSIGGFGGYLRRSELQPSIKTRLQRLMRPTTFKPTASAFPVTFTTKMRHPRDFPKAEPLFNPFSKEVHEYTNEKKKKIVEDNRKFREAMDLLNAKFGIEKKEMVIISFDQLKLEEEVKTEDDDNYHDQEEEEDPDDLQEELLESVCALPTDRETKQTDLLVRKALQSADIIKCISKLTPAS